MGAIGFIEEVLDSGGDQNLIIHLPSGPERRDGIAGRATGRNSLGVAGVAGAEPVTIGKGSQETAREVRRPSIQKSSTPVQRRPPCPLSGRRRESTSSRRMGSEVGKVETRLS